MVFSLWMGALVLFGDVAAYAEGGDPCTLSYIIDPNNPEDVECTPYATEQFTLPGERTIEVASGVLLVGFRDGVTADQKSAFYARHPIQSVDELELINAAILFLQPGYSVQQVYDGMSGEEILEYREPDAFFETTEAFPDIPPDGPYYSEVGSLLDIKQWYLPKMKVRDAWIALKAVPQSGQIKVAVVDTGVDRNTLSKQAHEDLEGQIDLYGVSAGRSYGSGTAYAMYRGDVPEGARSIPNMSHGTSVAGIIGVVTNNGRGIAGIGLGYVRILPVQLRQRNNGTFFSSALVNGLYKLYVSRNDVSVINMSLAAFDPNDIGWCSGHAPESCMTLYRVLTLWQNRGTFMAASAGNNNNYRPTYPAAHPGVVGVPGMTWWDYKTSPSTSCTLQNGSTIGYTAGSRWGNWTKLSAYWGLCDGGFPIYCPGGPCPYPTTDATPMYRGIVTLSYTGIHPPYDMEDKYTISFGGTSAASPMVAAGAALLQVARPEWTFQATKIYNCLREKSRAHLDPRYSTSPSDLNYLPPIIDIGTAVKQYPPCSGN